VERQAAGGDGRFSAVLDQVAGDEVYIHMARERAARIADAIRAGSK